MSRNKIRVCSQVDQLLSQLKGRTGLTPNLLCRLGFCLSLREGGVPNSADYPEDSQREFNRYSLTGEWDGLMRALLRERLLEDGITIDEGLDDHFRAHLNRGVILLHLRVKSLTDIAHLVEEAGNMRKKVTPA